MRVLHPSAGRDAVEAANDRDTHRLFDALHVFQVGLRPHVIGIQIRKVAQRLGIRMRAALQVVIEFLALVGDLFLEQGI